jgi:hypothetical protein
VDVEKQSTFPPPRIHPGACAAQRKTENTATPALAIIRSVPTNIRTIRQHNENQ